MPVSAANNLKPWRNKLSRLGYALVAGSVLVVVSLWSRTCALGGFHCFDGGAGITVEAAQVSIVFGLICSLLGQGTNRLLFAGIAFFELAFCYSRLLVH